VSGKILKEIQAQAGITPSELSKRLGKKDSHISNEIKKLDTERLIVRLKRGKNYELFLSVLGKEALDSVMPEQNSQIQLSVNETNFSANEAFFYANPEHLTAFNFNPQLPFARVH
jgi:DNA-binding MarR family transcriptional regulator